MGQGSGMVAVLSGATADDPAIGSALGRKGSQNDVASCVVRSHGRGLCRSDLDFPSLLLTRDGGPLHSACPRTAPCKAVAAATGPDRSGGGARGVPGSERNDCVACSGGGDAHLHRATVATRESRASGHCETTPQP